MLSLSLSLSLSQSSLIASNKKQGDNNNSNNTNNSIVIGRDINSINNNNNNNQGGNNSTNNSNVYTIDTTNIPTKNNYIFLGYSSNPTATTPEYAYNSTSNTFTPNSVTINAPTTGDTATLTLYAVWQRQPFTFDEAFAASSIAKYNDTHYYAMQDIDSTICERVYPYDQTTTLIDKRDNKTYTVAKLKMTPDGSQATCWMTQNLALILSTTTTLTNADTDLNSVTSWTPIRNTVTNVSQYANDDNTPYSYNPNNTSYGVYYNWSAAVASNNTSSMTAQYTNAPDSICPKGWRLPQIYGGSSTNRPNEFGNLLYAYGIINTAWAGDGQNAGWATNGYTKIQQAPINSPLTGVVFPGAVLDSGATGSYWSSSVNSAAYVYYFGFGNTAAFPQHNRTRYSGFPVRCVPR